MLMLMMIVENKNLVGDNWKKTENRLIKVNTLHNLCLLYNTSFYRVSKNPRKLCTTSINIKTKHNVNMSVSTNGFISEFIIKGNY